MSFHERKGTTLNDKLLQEDEINLRENCNLYGVYIPRHVLKPAIIRHFYVGIDKIRCHLIVFCFNLAVWLSDEPLRLCSLLLKELHPNSAPASLAGSEPPRVSIYYRLCDYGEGSVVVQQINGETF